MKVATSAQIKADSIAGLRLTWPDITDSVNAFRSDILHEQFFMMQMMFDKAVLSKIDIETSIAMSSKLAYQLAKLAD